MWIFYLIANRLHGTGDHTSCTLEENKNSKMDGDLNNKNSEYNNDVYIVAWTTGESGDLQYDIQLRSLTISSTKLGILVSSEIVKNRYLSFVFGFFKKLEDVMHQASILTLKNIGTELSIPRTHYSEHLNTVLMKSLHILEGDLYQNIQRVLKQDRSFAKYSKNVDRIRHLQMEYMSLKANAAWTQELDTIHQKCINQFICQKNQVDLTNIRFNIQPKGRNIFARSVLTHLFRYYSTGNVLLLVSSCSSGISLLQPSIPFMLRDYRKSRRMFQFQCDNPAVDSSNPMTLVTLMLSVNEQNSQVPVMFISLDEGGHSLLFLCKKIKNKHLGLAYTLLWDIDISLKLLYLQHAYRWERDFVE